MLAGLSWLQLKSSLDTRLIAFIIANQATKWTGFFVFGVGVGFGNLERKELLVRRLLFNFLTNIPDICKTQSTRLS